MCACTDEGTTSHTFLKSFLPSISKFDPPLPRTSFDIILAAIIAPDVDVDSNITKAGKAHDSDDVEHGRSNRSQADDGTHIIGGLSGSDLDTCTSRGPGSARMELFKALLSGAVRACDKKERVVIHA